MFIDNWLSLQTAKIVDGWSGSIAKYYPQHVLAWSDPDEHIKSLRDEWNTFDAVKIINWQELFVKKNLKILDLGCGAGWLSAFLSKDNNVSEIYALDSDKNMLEKMLPEIVKKMSGNMEKIKPVHGFFQPILVEDGFFDVVVSSSAVHHSADMEELLREINRVLKPGGKLVILNETPWSNFSYFVCVVKMCIRLLVCTMLRKTKQLPKQINQNGILYDPFLGDFMHAFYQWDQAIKKAGFSFKTIFTNLFTQKKQKNQKLKLVHFICDKAI